MIRGGAHVYLPKMLRNDRNPMRVQVILAFVGRKMDNVRIVVRNADFCHFLHLLTCLKSPC
jgi:hypothetical protein